jgi:hypothetical protein
LISASLRCWFASPTPSVARDTASMPLLDVDRLLLREAEPVDLREQLLDAGRVELDLGDPVPEEVVELGPRRGELLAHVAQVEQRLLLGQPRLLDVELGALAASSVASRAPLIASCQARYASRVAWLQRRTARRPPRASPAGPGGARRGCRGRRPGGRSVSAVLGARLLEDRVRGLLLPDDRLLQLGVLGA